MIDGLPRRRLAEDTTSPLELSCKVEGNVMRKARYDSASIRVTAQVTRL